MLWLSCWILFQHACQVIHTANFLRRSFQVIAKYLVQFRWLITAESISGSAPLTAVQMLWVNMIMDTLGALALATEPPHDGLMKMPPVGRNAKIITRVMWRNIIGQSIYQIIVLLVLKFRGKQILKLNGPDDATLLLNTVIFNTFVFCQVI